ncbi:dihydropteroate synthase [Planctomonas psychrotolerans]|uniref:dihydropteroate synthase n=1 Tax=Planctomonas psychrotolerans TaxID=2528712 RepID=UPI0012391DED|nr:dihydropteroate synthase [Planctomonas psychrotolerans]
MSTRILGILNVTPDSFSDGGELDGADAAIARGVRMTAEGADLVDVGGESTRPGAGRVSPAEEQRRVLPVIAALAAEGVTVSVDTLNADTASRAVAAGAALINDVSGGLADPDMARVVAEAGVPFVVMHWRGHSADMNSRAQYDDVVAEVRTELLARVDEVVRQGVDPDNVILDPGLGFAKNAEHNWALLGALEDFVDLGHRVLVGASRKRFLADVLPPDAGMADRDPATAVVSALAAEAGAWAVRVHDVPATRTALAVQREWRRHRG